MSVIPKKIFQSWKTKNLPPEMLKNVEEIKRLNSEYEYYLYDDEDCKKFLLTNFGQNYVNAFDALVPGAFKCDFWRYAMLYVEGGVYLDMDMTPLVPFREMIQPLDEFVSIVDQQVPLSPQCGIYQAFLASKPRHPALLYALQISFANIATRRIDTLEVLNITGPIVMGIGLNLFWEKKDPHSPFKPGRYGPTVLFSGELFMTKSYDLDGKPIFINKFAGYAQGVHYSLQNTYVDDPRTTKRRLFRYLFWGMIAVVIAAIIGVLIYRKRLKECAKGDIF